MLAAFSVAAVVLGVPAALAQSLSERKDRIDARISGLRENIEKAKEKEGVLSSEIDAASGEIDSVEAEIDVLTARLSRLERELSAHRERLARLDDLLRERTRLLEKLAREHARAQRQLEERLVELYQTDETTGIEILLQLRSLNDLIEQLDYFNEVGEQDKRIAERTKRLKLSMRAARARTAAAKAKVAEATAVLAEKTEEERATRERLVAEERALAAARSRKQDLLVRVKEQRHDHEEDLEAMRAASASLAEKIRAAQAAAAAAAAARAASEAAASEAAASGAATSAAADATPSASGLIWPVSGPVVSGFGPRWGQMHEGIDIAVPTGTTVVAAASGQVIYAGAMGGYGNLVVVEHGGGLATAYAHLSAIWVSGGSVSQGQGIASSGCTGHCLGPHVHFEVRVNGAPVDPLGYL